MVKQEGITRRGFIKKAGLLAALGAGSIGALGQEATANSGKFATLIDLTKCDGCKHESMPKCVAACRQQNAQKFPEPKEPIKNLWPQKTYDDWSKKREVISTLTPYNWITVQKVIVEGEEVFIPRRCMHCDNPPCAHLCPVGALNKYPEGAVVINPDLCLGGAKCKAVCPWHIPQRQSGVGLYLKLQPIPAGGGVMYKCDLCRERITQGQLPACVEACQKRLGEERPLFFGERIAILKEAHGRAKRINGYIYGEKENGGTGTIYVSRVPFERIDAQLKEKNSHLRLGKVNNPLSEVNSWAKGFLLGPLILAAGAIGLALREKREKIKAEAKDAQGKQEVKEGQSQ